MICTVAADIAGQTSGAGRRAGRGSSRRTAGTASTAWRRRRTVASFSGSSAAAGRSGGALTAPRRSSPRPVSAASADSSLRRLVETVESNVPNTGPLASGRCGQRGTSGAARDWRSRRAAQALLAPRHPVPGGRRDMLQGQADRLRPWRLLHHAPLERHRAHATLPRGARLHAQPRSADRSRRPARGNQLLLQPPGRRGRARDHGQPRRPEAGLRRPQLLRTPRSEQRAASHSGACGRSSPSTNARISARSASWCSVNGGTGLTTACAASRTRRG